MSEGRFGRRLGRCVLVALFGAAFAIAGVSSAYAAVTSGDSGYSSTDESTGGSFSTLDFSWG